MCLNPIYLEKQEIWCDCRQCAECRHKRAREWACRCWAELQTQNNVGAFITLTYSDENNPIILQKRDAQLFIKRLRKRIAPHKIKYFACGEYGDRTLRPHFHIIIFGYDFPDKVYFTKSKKGKPIFRSAELAELWKSGLHTVQEVNIATCVYTALYTAKATKTLPKRLQSAPEFNTMSQGIGIEYLKQHYDRYKQTDAIWIDGEAYAIPNALFDKVYKRNLDKGCVDYAAHLVNSELKTIKEKRLEQYRLRYPKHHELLDELVEADDLSKRVKTYEALVRWAKATRERNRAIQDKLYRQKNKKVDKTL